MSDNWPVGSWRIRAHAMPYQANGVALYAWLRQGIDRVSALEQQTSLNGAQLLREVDPREISQQPAFNLSREEAQVLMDSLWDSGLRPTQGHASEGAIGATNAHLNDMRALVSHYSKAKLP